MPNGPFKFLLMKKETKKQSAQELELEKAIANSRFFQMVDKVPYSKSKKGQAFVKKSSKR
jgi:hypothetical protein